MIFAVMQKGASHVAHDNARDCRQKKHAFCKTPKTINAKTRRQPPMKLYTKTCTVCGTRVNAYTPDIRKCPHCGYRFPGSVTRQTMLDEAAKCVNADRNKQYGEPENSLIKIAAMWTVYLNGRSVISAADVAAMMALFKTARVASGQAKADNWIDIAGYTAYGGEVQCNTSCR